METIELSLAKRAINCSKWEWREGMLSQNKRIMYWYFSNQYMGLNQDTNKRELFIPDIPDFLDAITIGAFSKLIEDLIGKSSDEFKNLKQLLQEKGLGREYLAKIVDILEKIS